MKNPAAVSLGRLGGKAGKGKSKARKVTSEQARAAVAARWAKTKRKPKRAARLPNAPGERPGQEARELKP
jgi:hypothetical protein